MRSHTEHAEVVAALISRALDEVRSAAPETLPIGSAALSGRIVARDVAAAIALPPFDNSQMDGYAARAADFAGPGPFSFRVGVTAAAGDAPVDLEPGRVSPVMTGAPIPRGADSVIPIEAADPPVFSGLRRSGDPNPDGPVPSVSFTEAPQAGAYVRVRGSDHAVGAPLVTAGTRLRPTTIGLLASAGIVEVPVRRRPRVLLVSTGDEVTEPGEPLSPGRIYDANAPLLAAALREAGAEVTPRRVVDHADELRALIAELGPEHDVLVTSGGISAGAFEVVRDALERDATAPSITFTGIALQPGGPQGAGTVTVGGRDLATLCFPGNPVSSALSAELFLLPLLRAYAGLPEHGEQSTARLAHAVDSPEHKHQVRRGRFTADGTVELTPPSSHLLADLAAAELLAHIPVGVAHLPTGSPIEIQRFDV